MTQAWTAQVVLATSVEGELTSYVLLFLLVVLGCAGVPMVATAAVTSAAILASQGVLSIDVVIAVACAAAVVGVPVGYGAGQRWGLGFMQRPGRLEERRGKALEQGHTLFSRWGWLACIFIPAFIAGIARMRFMVFEIFKTTAALSYQVVTALAAYGAAKVVSGHVNPETLAELAAWVVLIVLLVWRLILPRRRRTAGECAASAATAEPEGGADRRYV